MANDAVKGNMKKATTRFTTFIGDAKTFIREELWDSDLATLPRVKRFIFSLCRITTIVVKGFVADNCSLQASALTYMSLMSMVPILALMLSVSKGMGAQKELMQVIGLSKSPETGLFIVVEGSRLSELPGQAAKIAERLFTAVDNTNFGALGAIGLLLLLWTVLKAMGRVEKSFNLIWGIKQSRTFFRKFSDYISILIVVPILILGATSVNAMLSSDKLLASLQDFWGPLYWVYQHTIRLSGIVSILLAFSFLYIFMPNTKVRAFPALLAGLVSGSVWYLTQMLYIELQVGVTRNNAIYGTFAAIPFFLMWLYVSWLIVLFGAEVGFATQHYRTFFQENSASRASLAVRETLAMIVTYETCKSFYEGENGWSASAFGEKNSIPARLLSDIILVLSEQRVLAPMSGEESRYLPAKDIGHLSPADVENAFRGSNNASLNAMANFERAPICRIFQEKYEQFTQQLANVTFRDIIDSRLDQTTPAPSTETDTVHSGIPKMIKEA